MRRIATLLLAACMLLSFVACTSEHIHSFGEWGVTKAPTCTEPGEEERVCSCGEKEVQTVAATGHSVGEWVTTKEPTCVEDGISQQFCSICNVQIKSESIPAQGHNFGEWYVTKEATCVKEGEKERICTCGFKETDSYISDHSPNYINCYKYQSGFTASCYCPICNVNYQKSIAPIEASIDMSSLTPGTNGWNFAWRIKASGGVGPYCYSFQIRAQDSNYVLYLAPWQDSNIIEWPSYFNDSLMLSTPISVSVLIRDSLVESVYVFNMSSIWGIDSQQLSVTRVAQ